MRAKLAPWLLLVILLPPYPAAQTPQEAPLGDHYLCVEAGASALRQLGLEADEVYQSFVMVQASSADMARLRGAGLPFFELEDRELVVLPGATFRLTDEDLAGKGLLAFAGKGDGPFIVIVKLKGPEKAEWLEALKGTGARLLGGPLSHYNLVAEAGRGQLEALGRLNFVSWLGELRPAQKLAAPLPDKGQFKFDMVFFKEMPKDFASAISMVEEAGGTVIERDDATAWWNSALVTAPAEAARSILELPGLWALERSGVTAPRNDVARWVVQSFDASGYSTPYWDEALTGRDVIIGLADSGIDFDHIGFRDKLDDQGVPGPDHRKIVRYNTSVDDWDQLGHGTHVAGSLAGDGITSPNMYDTNDGLALGARIAFYDIVDVNGSWEPPLIRGILGDAYDAGAKSHSDSWGDESYAYSLRAQRIDQFQWDRPEFLTFVAAGNRGPGAGTVEEPATAKNIVAMGASANGNTSNLSSLSAHGPTQEGLIAPTLVAPGQSIYSAASDSQPYSYNAGFRYMTGTSMATPFGAAADAIVQQYFKEGYYPNGSRGSGPGFLPSGPLRKAVLVASGADQYGGNYVDNRTPDYSQGWGKIRLTNVLYLASSNQTRRLWVEDVYNDSRPNDGLATGESRTERLSVNSSLPLKIVLSWNDWPGAGLINDLNLEVTAPDGKVYRGNQFLNGSSVASERADSTNTVEAVFIADPERGLYTIKVAALRVANGERQRYALAATGDLLDPGVAMLRLDRQRTGLNSTLHVSLSDSGLRGAGTVVVNATSDQESEPERITLMETGMTGMFTGSLDLRSGSPARDGMLQVAEGNRALVSYYDTDPPGLAWDEALVDGAPPRVVKCALENVTDNSAYLKVETDEPSRLTIAYWSNLGSQEASDPEVGFSHAMQLDWLRPRTGYSLDLLLADLYGNGARFDFDGQHLDFDTHDLTLRPRPGFSGYAVSGEAQNRFGDEAMLAGVSADRGMLAGFRFDAGAFPKGTMVSGAQLRLMVKNTDPALSTSTWSVELLEPASALLFDGTDAKPSYAALKNATAADAVGTTLPASSMPALRWLLIDLSPQQCRLLDADLAQNRTAFRIGYQVLGADSYVEWYANNSAAVAFYAPQLVLDLDYPPKVSPGALTGIVMQEDAVDSSSVNLSRMFNDSEPLKFSAPENAEGSGANLTATIGLDGRVTIRPRQDWNGAERIQFKATDPYGLWAAHEVNVTVMAENDPPRIVAVNGTPAQEGMRFSVLQDDTLTMPVEAEDPDLLFEGESLGFTTNDSLVRFTSTHSGVLSFTPDNKDIGVRKVTVTVRDPDYEDSIVLTFEILNVNDPPQASLESPINGERFDNVTPVRLSALGSTDPDLPWGDELNYTWESNVSGVLGHGPELELVFEPGMHCVVLTVMDQSGAYDQLTANITVEAVEPPPPPPPPSTGTADETYYRLGAVIFLLLALIFGWTIVAPRRPKDLSEPEQRIAGPPGTAPEPDGPEGPDGPVLDVEQLEEE